MGAGVGGVYANAPIPDIWNILGSPETVKQMRQFDNWRRWIGFESVEALVEAYEPAAKLQGIGVYDLINRDYHKWQEDRK